MAIPETAALMGAGSPPETDDPRAARDQQRGGLCLSGGASSGEDYFLRRDVARLAARVGPAAAAALAVLEQRSS